MFRIGRRPEVVSQTKRLDSGKMNVICPFCGAMMWIDEKSNSSSINPEFQLCCGKGQYVVERFSPTPSLISNLLKGNDAISKEFKQNIRAYNSSLSFTSLGVQLDSSVQNRINGAYTFRIHGNLYHNIGTSLEPTPGRAPCYAQIYIYDAANELDNRHSTVKHISRETLAKLQAMMHEVNPYVHDFKTMADLDRETPGGIKDLSMVFKSENTPDPRRYNPPTHNTEIGILIMDDNVGRDPTQPTNRDIVLRFKRSSEPGRDTQTIKEINQNYDPMHYVLIFPTGNFGWNIETRSVDAEKKVSIMDFYSFHLMYRLPANNNGSFDLHLFGALFHQYIVDMYAKMEHQRLQYIRHNQESLRRDLYSNLQDAVEVNDCDPSVLGKKTILPSSFIGSPRHMTQLYQDAMSIVRRFGKPDLFVTFTCNPNWQEIQRELLYGQKANDRPDLCSRVFNLKLRSLLHDLTKKHVLGKVVAYVYTIEFQKRGLPHAHILLILDRIDKIDERDIDSIVSAEIPDQTTSPLLYETVTKNMMHGPCGPLYPKASCMKNGKCSKDFPKPFNNTTTFPETAHGGYPKYRRRDDGKIVTRSNGFQLNNRWVVPHNPFLSAKYNAHINVELCASFVSVKYVYKYVYKGHDCAQVSMEDKHDEIQKFVDARYVSAPEACWRLFSFSLHGEWPSHLRLAIHLPNEQNVYYHDNDNLNDILHRAKTKDTTLTGWFEMNSQSEYARRFLYTEFPEHFVWVKSKSMWKKREKGHHSTIGRMYAVSPREVEKFCLRIILLHVRGATSFEDLKTVDGVLYPTFREAACAMNLLEDDEEWKRCLHEACSYQSPAALRNLFVIIIVFNAPQDPYELWSLYRDFMVEDYLHERREKLGLPDLLPDQTVYDCGICDIEDRLQSQGFTLTSYTGFELPDSDPRNLYEDFLSEEQLKEPRVIREQLLLNAHTSLEPLQQYTFNPDQQATFNRIMQLVRSSDVSSSRAVFIDGPGGTGKTYLFNALLDTVRREVGIAFAVAASGTAALLLRGGKTAHSGLKIPLSCDQYSMCAISPSDNTARLIRQTKMIVWDEASMISRDILEAVDRTFREVCKVDDPQMKDVPFGGRVIVFGGDFRQVLPVVPKAAKPEIIAQCINRSFLWSHVTKMRLTTNMRVQTALTSNDQALAQTFQAFADYLLKIGSGDIPAVNGHSAIRLDENLIIPGSNLLHLTSAVFHTFSGSLFNNDRKKFLINRAILTPLNSHVAEINSILLNQLEGEMHVLYSADKLCSDDNNDSLRYPSELLNKIDAGSLPPHCLSLKVGCPIMLLRNLDPANGLCNGTRLFCLAIRPRAILAEIATGRNVGDIVTIPRISLMSQEEQVGIQFSRLQFPVRPAFAMTINKSQGQTLDFVGLYLPSSVFSHGQLYVAMSRVKTPSSLKILISHETSSKNCTDNIVYKEILE